jgi:hypothetical protein
MNNSVVLTEIQKTILSDFYSKPKNSVLLNKPARDMIWKDFKKNRSIEKYADLEISSPALYLELTKALSSKKNIQSAVFSECVYTQALAEKYSLSIFHQHITQTDKRITINGIPEWSLNNLSIRYSYTNADQSLLLVQAGGAGSVDCALIAPTKKLFSMIEFKEFYSRTSEPDLPKYGDDGFLVTSEKFDRKYPQFKSMLEEQIAKKLNLLDSIGGNIGTFSAASIEKAVSENYIGSKKADVICTEDKFGNLVMLPSNEVGLWAELEGEIRPSGRNAYNVWSHDRLLKDISSLGGKVKNGYVEVQSSLLEPRDERGGTRKSGLKINALFFVRVENVQTTGDLSIFNIEDVEQLNPSISAKMKFKDLDYENVKNYYLKRV